ncbi:NUDIX hydrolase [Candidatus Nitrosotalea bavarica]|uniref:NUDIX hydrolase n=1 Tax=Candidatus Nitrosotalea bavarica TaxID=1903277 RepID=UPI001FE9BFC8|nr:CoA pyrophosphatase [Candidatus Nitrosotalea bavarica]
MNSDNHKTLDVENLKQILTNSIMPEVQGDSNSKLAAVMIIIFGNEPMLLMTERSKTMNHHAGEISFPGGTWEAEDGDLLGTAIREAREELCMEISRSMVIGKLKPVTTLNSGFTITPFIAILDELPTIVPNSEIESVLRMPLFTLLKTIEDDKDPSHKSILEMYTFKFKDHLIWGASARMLKQILAKIS